MSLALSGEAAARPQMSPVVSFRRHHRIFQAVQLWHSFCRSGEKGLNETYGNSHPGTDPCSTPPLLLSLTETVNRLYGKTIKSEQGHNQDLVPTVPVLHKASPGLQEKKKLQPAWQNLCLSFSYHLLSSEALCWHPVLLLFREAAVGMFMFMAKVHLGYCLKGCWGCKPPKIDIKYLLIQHDSLLSWLGGFSQVMKNLNQVLQ